MTVSPPMSLTATNARRVARMTGREWRYLAETVAHLPAGTVTKFYEDGCLGKPCDCLPLAVTSGGAA